MNQYNKFMFALRKPKNSSPKEKLMLLHHKMLLFPTTLYVYTLQFQVCFLVILCDLKMNIRICILQRKKGKFAEVKTFFLNDASWGPPWWSSG